MAGLAYSAEDRLADSAKLRQWHPRLGTGHRFGGIFARGPRTIISVRLADAAQVVERTRAQADLFGLHGVAGTALGLYQ
jgi:hypothetical protein